MKFQGSTLELHPILPHLSSGGASGIHGVAVKCVEIVRNTSGEGEMLDTY